MMSQYAGGTRQIIRMLPKNSPVKIVIFLVIILHGSVVV